MKIPAPCPLAWPLMASLRDSVLQGRGRGTPSRAAAPPWPRYSPACLPQGTFLCALFVFFKGWQTGSALCAARMFGQHRGKCLGQTRCLRFLAKPSSGIWAFSGDHWCSASRTKSSVTAESSECSSIRLTTLRSSRMLPGHGECPCSACHRPVKAGRTYLIIPWQTGG